MFKKITALMLALAVLLACFASTAASAIVEPSASYKQYRQYFNKVSEELENIEDESESFLIFALLLWTQDLIIDTFIQPFSEIKAKDLSSINKAAVDFPINEYANANMTYKDYILRVKITPIKGASDQTSGNMYYYANSGRYAMDLKSDGKIFAFDMIKGKSVIYTQMLVSDSSGTYTGVRTMFKNGSLTCSLASEIKAKDVKTLRITKAPESFTKFAYKKDARFNYSKGVVTITVDGKKQTLK